MRRRALLIGSGALGAGAVAGVLLRGEIAALFSGSPAISPSPSPVSALVPDPGGLLDLPKGFKYTILSREGNPLSGGDKVGSLFDGMCYLSREGKSMLVRNHECDHNDDAGKVTADASLTFDAGGNGGVSVLTLASDQSLAEERVMLAGTSRNCAGGVTPWQTWLSCEESEDQAGKLGYQKDHGWIFEVDPFEVARNASPTPLVAMGRFSHEAVCVDPATGIVYETEDPELSPWGTIYRFMPAKPLGGYGSLRAGGTLQALHIPSTPDLSTITTPGTELPDVRWADVPDPAARTTPTRSQDYGRTPITRAQKLEGAWWGANKAYFVSSFSRKDAGSAGDHNGQVWSYDPARNTMRLEVIFGFNERQRDPEFEAPDNICMSPHGGYMMCQDGNGTNYIMGVSAEGQPYVFARSRRSSELAGVAFSADGKTMYFNNHDPGITYAITGDFGTLH